MEQRHFSLIYRSEPEELRTLDDVLQTTCCPVLLTGLKCWTDCMVSMQQRHTVPVQWTELEGSTRLDIIKQSRMYIAPFCLTHSAEDLDIQTRLYPAAKTNCSVVVERNGESAPPLCVKQRRIVLFYQISLNIQSFWTLSREDMLRGSTGQN